MKIFKKILAVVVSIATVFAFVGCDTIVDGNKITKVQVELAFYNADGQEDTDLSKTVMLYLYRNNAPKTVEHITELINAGYYDGACISNVQSGWCEFGNYVYNDGTLADSNKKANYVDGEFSSNGFTGQTLSVAGGSLVLKRSDESTDEVSRYNSGKSTVIVCFSSNKFTKSDYAVFGKVVDESEDTDENENLEAFKKVLDYKSDNDTSTEAEKTTTKYYYEKEGKTYTVVSVDGEKTYYEGATTQGNKLTEAEVETLETLMTDEADYFLTVPTVKVVIKSMKVVK